MNYKNYMALFLIMTSIMHASDDHKQKKKIKKNDSVKKNNRFSSKQYKRFANKLSILTFDFAVACTEMRKMNEHLTTLSENIVNINAEAKKALERLGTIAMGIQFVSNSTTEESSSNNQDQSDAIDDIGSLQFTRSSNNRSQETFGSNKLKLKKTPSSQARSFKHTNQLDGIRVLTPRKGPSSPKRESLKSSNNQDDSKNITVIKISNMDDVMSREMDV